MINKEERERMILEAELIDAGKRQRTIERSDAAKMITEHPVFVEAHTNVKAQLLAEWAATGVNDVERRERIWGMYNAIDKSLSVLRLAMESGKLAEGISKSPRPKFWKVT